MMVIPSFEHCSLPSHLLDASPEAQHEFYRLVVSDVFNAQLSAPEIYDDGWHGWTDLVDQPLPDGAPESLKAQLPSGWKASFDINWLTSDGDWGWDATHEHLGGWDVMIAIMGAEWINLAGGWEQQSGDNTLCGLKGRKLIDGGWLIEVIPAEEVA
jgi:hypothetical protein